MYIQQLYLVFCINPFLILHTFLTIYQLYQLMLLVPIEFDNQNYNFYQNKISYHIDALYFMSIKLYLHFNIMVVFHIFKLFQSDENYYRFLLQESFILICSLLHDHVHLILCQYLSVSMLNLNHRHSSCELML